MAFNLKDALLGGKKIGEEQAVEEHPVVEEQPVVEEKVVEQTEEQPVVEEGQPVVEKEKVEEKPVVEEEKVVEKESPEEVLKEEPIRLDEGYQKIIEEDEFIKNLLDYRKEKGDVSPFLQAYAQDFEKMSDDEILRQAFEADTATQGLGPKAKDRLYREQVLNKYAVNEDEFEDDEAIAEEKEFRAELKKRDANQIRANLKEQQKQYQQTLIPEQPSEEDIQADLKELEEVTKAGLKDVLANKKITVKPEGVELNYEIPSVDNMYKHALDASTFLKDSFYKNDESVDWDKYALVSAFAQNPDSFMSELVKVGKAAGKAEFESALKNPSALNNETKPNVEKAKGTPKSNPKGFLEEALKQQGKI